MHGQQNIEKIYIFICSACLTVFQEMGVKLFGNLHITLGTPH